MRKKISIILFIIIFLLTGCKEKEIEESKKTAPIVEDVNVMNLQRIDNYDMNLVFYPEDATIKGIQKIDYMNKENVSLAEVYFHLYPNSFRKKETTPFLMDDFKRAYPEGFQPGAIDVQKVAVNGKTMSYHLEGKGETILKVVLPKAIKPEERVLIEMTYTVKIPPAQERFGYGEDTFNLGNWYPIAAVYDETGWNLDPYYALGDPFYSDVSNYNVHIETPKDYMIASSGNVMKDEVVNGSRFLDIEAKQMRDFAWVISKDFELVEKDVEGTTLKMYFIKEQQLTSEIMDIATASAENAIKTFNRVYGKYPYAQYSVVQTNFPSGMEYPGIVFIMKDAYSDAWKDYLEVVIVHETGHQWWYGVVGNNEIDEAWLDESLTSYSEVIYEREIKGKELADKYYKYMHKEAYVKAAPRIENEKILRPLNQFEGWEDYGTLVYNKGAMFIHAIYETYGEEKFYEIMQNYFNTYKFKNATTKDFKKVCEEVTGENLDGFFNKWLLAQ
ncbi:M1 family metallopeptidase [Marinisporobacter balticus]|uniref:Peptidase M1-like protein n=1 Tax=Marinisporobacter balticus TaxID=2018667 RepID=A0A4R2KKB3_9FIRM|nr:M1 family metallopeptidase [Marinisporobacter balticus]TCO71066.1 peptidase M1-like protein [Marinisporobacter balticus]